VTGEEVGSFVATDAVHSDHYPLVVDLEIRADADEVYAFAAS
jgi:hypothetical protein